MNSLPLDKRGSRLSMDGADCLFSREVQDA